MLARLTFIAAIALCVVGMPVTVQAEQPKPQIGFRALVARADYDPAAEDPIKDGLLDTSLPSSLRIAWKGVLKPRHFLGVSANPVCIAPLRLAPEFRPHPPDTPAVRPAA
jgi:hypothetical protein